MKKFLAYFLLMLPLISVSGVASAKCQTSCKAYCAIWETDLASGATYCTQWVYYDCTLTCDQ